MRYLLSVLMTFGALECEGGIDVHVACMEHSSSTTTHETWGCLAESEAQGGSASRVSAGFWARKENKPQAPGFQPQ